eukprot:TRINITY_DN66186_c6_g6_i1.p1 TRINITY_DN66186_c6_g6~~TRINITY_DN66186_c6_g6_i1.p1  ORF type:complete len:518 (+),score=55.40 TRINITY_DN66186_c6_g6_i1:44-1597(+)
MEPEELEEAKENLRRFCKRATDLLHRVDCLRQRIAKRVDGLDKFRKSVHTELRFLQSMENGKVEITRSRVQCLNIMLYESLLMVLDRESEGLISVGTNFPFDGKARGLKIDVVCGYGSKWIKVKAMNPKNIVDVVEGKGRFGEKSVIEMAEDFVRCATQNPVNFGAPSVEFAFSDLPGIPQYILQELSDTGVEISEADPNKLIATPLPELLHKETKPNASHKNKAPYIQSNSRAHPQHNRPQGQFFYPSHQLTTPPTTNNNTTTTTTTTTHNDTSSSSTIPVTVAPDSSDIVIIPLADSSDEEDGNGKSGVGQQQRAVDPSTISIVNLDVTALIALTSELVHGGAVNDFPKHPVLQRQAEDERKRPLLGGLKSFLLNKQLVVCNKAQEEFQTILDTVGGPNEKERAKALLNCCKLVPDDPSPASLKLTESRRIQDRQRVIFGTGDTLRAVTLTANVGFVRAAADQGVHFAAFAHASRALTEYKQVVSEQGAVNPTVPPTEAFKFLSEGSDGEQAAGQ